MRRRSAARGGMERVANPGACLLGIPVEVRSKIYEYVFADLIAQLPDNLFAVLTMYDHTYNLTATWKKKCKWRWGSCTRLQFQPMCPGHRAELRLSQPEFWADHCLRRLLDYIGKHPEQRCPSGATCHSEEGDRRWFGKTGLTSLLLVNRRIYEEDLEVLCAQSEFVVSVMGGGGPQGGAAVRFVGGCPYLTFAKRMKVNVHVDSNKTANKIIRRLGTLLAAISAGGRLRSLQLFFKGTSSVDQASMDHLMKLLEGHLGGPLKQRRCSVKVYLGEVSRELISHDRISAFANTLQG